MMRSRACLGRLFGLTVPCLIVVVMVLFVSLAGPGDVFAAAPPGCTAQVTSNLTSGFDSGDFDLHNVAVDADGSFYLETGFQAIDPQSIVIPFEQEVWVSFFYEDAGYTSTLGWMLKEDAVDADGDFLGWNNIPTEDKHPVFGLVQDCCGGGDGVLDALESMTEAELSVYDDPNAEGRFIVDGDDSVTAEDMRKSLGTFAAGTELIFWLANDNGSWDPPNGDVFYNKTDWNPDTYQRCTPAVDDPRWISASTFRRTYELGVANAGEDDCDMSKGFLDGPAITRLNDVFGLTMSGTYDLLIEDHAQFSHTIVAAPDEDPNQWILSWEDLHEGGDMDYNDITFRIERKTGGTANMAYNAAVIPSDPEAFYTAVSFAVYDSLPGGSCANKTRIDYYVSIDNGANWVEVRDWDRVKAYTVNGDGDKIPGDEITDWTPGYSGQTYREVRIDFAGLDLAGRELVWKADLLSEDEACAPIVAGSLLDGATSSHAFISRSSPIMVGNVLYSGSFETPALTWTDRSRPRGHIKATRIYDPIDPSTDDQLALWDGGPQLDAESPADRTLYYPDVAVFPVVSEALTLSLPDGTEVTEGDGSATTFSGTLATAPIVATTVRIWANTHIFVDEGTDILSSDWGYGTINRFTGEFTITFDTPPALGVPILANYSYYTTGQTPLALTPTNVTNEMLALDDTFINPTGYKYDLDGDDDYDEEDGDWLVDWLRGYEDGRYQSQEKEWKLGAIDHSVPALVTPPGTPSWYYGTDITTTERESYESFRLSHEARDTVLFVGGRDGMLHAFDAGKFRWGDNAMTAGIVENRGYFLWEDLSEPADGILEPNYGTGDELWAFIPANLMPRLKNNLLQADDQAFVDAASALADVKIGGTWKTVLLTAQGNGGDTVFCLDVTDPHNPLFLWEFADPELFRSRSSPAVGQIGRIRIGGIPRWAAFFVSGKTYDATLYPSIYVIDIADGSVIDRIFLDSDPAGQGGVPSGQPAIVDADGNGYIDRLYIGTDKGRMYKVSLSDDPLAFWTATASYVINADFIDDDGSDDGAGNPVAVEVPVAQRWHPIYASPSVVVDNTVADDGTLEYQVRIFFGTGDSPYFDEGIDIGNTTYHFFAYVDREPKGYVVDGANPSRVELDWFYDLPAGHRIFASAFSAAGKVYFGTATSETEDPCGGPNDGQLYVFDVDGYELDNPAAPTTVISTGDIITTPLVEDEHLYVRTPSGMRMVGGGGFNNETQISGFGQAQPASWREVLK